MRSIALRILAAIALSAGCTVAAHGQSQEYNGEPRRAPRSQETDQIIVKWRAGAAGAPIQKLANAGLRLQRKQRIASDTEVLQLDRRLDRGELESVLAALRADTDVEYAVANQRRHAHLLPADPLIAEQWYFLDAQPSATRAQHAWDVTIGSAATIVAVVDTGVRFEHPDLGRVETGGKLLPGFDFIANLAVANDGDGPDADASDPGDWVSATDAQAPPFDRDCVPEGADHVDSSWHGTRVASLIGALTNNGAGMAGSSWETVLLPVRVLGKCGGFDSDIISGMRWAAGLLVSGVPLNPNPAHIINVSLGGDGACSAAYQSAISEITSRGVLVIASVGNDAGPVSAPANCNGALGVAAIRHAGTKVGFSNLGPAAMIAAPGGNCVNPAGQPCLFSILAATNTGVTTPAQSSFTDQLNINVGTSFSAPIVAGAAALMHSLNARLSPVQYTSLLRETARPFPVANASIPVCQVPVDANDTQAGECACTTQTCGAGMLDTQAAVLAAQRPFAVANVPATIAVGANVTLDGRGSFAANDRTVIVYQWSALNVTGATPIIGDTAQPLTTLQVSGSSSFTLRLTVTDDRGAQDTADFAVAVATAPPMAAPTSAGSGGGGGGIDALALMLAGLLSMSLRHARCRRRALKC
jgi:serine protease